MIGATMKNLNITIQFLYTSAQRMTAKDGVMGILNQFANVQKEYTKSTILPGFADLIPELKKASNIRDYMCTYTEKMAKIFDSDIHSVVINDFNGEYLIGVQYNKSTKSADCDGECGKSCKMCSQSPMRKSVLTVVTVSNKCSQTNVLNTVLDVANTMINIIQ